MVLFKYNNLSFSEQNDKVKVTFLNIYYFYLDKNELKFIGDYKLTPNSIEFSGQKKEANITQKFEFMLSEGFNGLKSSINNKPALYVHRNSGIPLIGTNEFGIIDRGTNAIEIKPMTTCNIDCIFCSVDHTKRASDVVVEADYLIDELKKVIKIKENIVNIHIGSQGDPSLYGNLEYLVKEIRKIKQIGPISMVSNGVIITKQMADRLIKAGMTHFHISLHTTNQEMADKLANSKYPVKKVMDVCRYIAKKAHLLLVPVWVPGINDKDVEEVIKFSKEIGAGIGVQNFLEYKFGKKPANPLPMKVFYQRLEQLEEKLDVDLTTLGGDLKIVPDNRLPKPFKKGEVITVEIKAKDRMKNAVLAVAKERVVTVINCQRLEGQIKVKLIRDKDNIFIATPMIR
jgi:uncharacterized protein